MSNVSKKDVSKKDVDAMLVTLAEKFELNGSVSSDDYGALVYGVLLENEMIDEETFVAAMEFWEFVPKNASAMRQRLFEGVEGDGEKLSRAQIMAKKYGVKAD